MLVDVDDEFVVMDVFPVAASLDVESFVEVQAPRHFHIVLFRYLLLETGTEDIVALEKLDPG